MYSQLAAAGPTVQTGRRLGNGLLSATNFSATFFLERGDGKLVGTGVKIDSAYVQAHVLRSEKVVPGQVGHSIASGHGVRHSLRSRLWEYHRI